MIRTSGVNKTMIIKTQHCNGRVEEKERKYVVINYGESGYDICSGIFDTPREALGCVLELFLEALGDDVRLPVTMQYSNDEANGDWEEFTFTLPQTDQRPEFIDHYKIYFQDTVLSSQKGE